MKPVVINVLAVDSRKVAAWMNYHAVRSNVKRVYPKTDAKCYWATSGNEAVAMVSDGIIDFGVILMGSDTSVVEGSEAIKNLREPPVKFEEAIVGVGWADALAVADFIEAGANKVFQRPLTDDNLAAVMPFISKLNET